MFEPGRPRIVDFSTHLSGPIASYLLRDLGAEVIKVENPKTGDGLRDLLPRIASTGKYHAGINAGARSLAISTRSEHWTEVVAGCARWADAVIVGSRPADARKRGLDFATLRAANPDLVYCSVSGYGATGPWAAVPAHGQNVDARAGLLPVEWTDGMPTTPSGWRSSGTLLSGVFAALGIMGALYRREIGGPAEYVSTSLWSAAMWSNWRDLNLLANNGRAGDDYQSFGSRYSMYPTLDDRAILLCPIEQKFWERFCEALKLPEGWAQRGDWSTSHADYGYEDERSTIAERMRTKTLDDWCTLFEEIEIPFAPLLSAAEAMDSGQAEANQLLRSIDVDGETVRVVASAVRLAPDDETEPPLRDLGGPPPLGGDNDAVLAEIGLGDLVGRVDLTGGQRPGSGE
jgi:crotonobetainyl-CoA:carnitine CoA-transferase CaiB-like acyl-CoA transferase